MLPILRTVSLSKSFLLAGKPRLILDGLDFQMAPESFVCVVGSSGCGKSTFLELLAGITRPEKGEIFYQEKPITGKCGYLGYMPQDDLLFPWLNVVENVLLPVRVKQENIKAARAKIAGLLPVFGLEEHAGHLPYQLSGGLRQRAAFLRTYMANARLLLLDEPFASLDAITRIQLQEWLKVISCDLKLSIILVTHDISEAISLGDVIQVMQSAPGKFIASFEVDRSLYGDETAKTDLKNKILGLVGQARP
ncbi:MAG: ATP-binding cassette domain-containing protein [Candidatus Syntrophosphaera sp.]|nr:ATP-binding cassette domain-containing protein [Candidatus Syntrophosphaera sp.]